MQHWCVLQQQGQGARNARLRTLAQDSPKEDEDEDGSPAEKNSDNEALLAARPFARSYGNFL